MYVKKPVSAQNIMFIDTETGGLSPRDSDIVQIAVVLTDPRAENVLAEWETKVKPRKPVHPRAAAVNGYNEAAWRDAPEIDEVIRYLADQSKGTVFGAHNMPFDWAFVEAAMEAAGVRWRGAWHKIDTLTLSYPLLHAGLVPDVKLATLCEFFEIEQEKAHDALSDVRNCMEIYRRLMGVYGPAVAGLKRAG